MKRRFAEQDILLKNLGLRGLRVAVVDHLVQQLVGDYKVVADALFFEALKVLFEDLA